MSKLKRHVETKHPGLEKSNLPFAIKMGDIIAKNEWPKQVNVEKSLPVEKQIPNRHKVTNLISSGCNYK